MRSSDASVASFNAAAMGRRLVAVAATLVFVIYLAPCAGSFTLLPPHTFSTSGRPRMPFGRKISTTIRIENAATSLYSMEK